MLNLRSSNKCLSKRFRIYDQRQRLQFASSQLHLWTHIIMALLQPSPSILMVLTKHKTVVQKKIECMPTANWPQTIYRERGMPIYYHFYKINFARLHRLMRLRFFSHPFLCVWRAHHARWSTATQSKSRQRSPINTFSFISNAIDRPTSSMQHPANSYRACEKRKRHTFSISFALFTRTHNAVAHNSPKSIWIWLARNGMKLRQVWWTELDMYKWLRELWLVATAATATVTAASSDGDNKRGKPAETSKDVKSNRIAVHYNFNIA